MTGLQLEVEVSRGIARLICSGRITDGNAAERMDATIQKLLSEADHLEMNLAGITYMDSTGIGVLVRNMVRAKSGRKRITVRGLSEVARKALKTANVLQQIELLEPQDEVSLKGARIVFVNHSPELREFVTTLLSGYGAEVSAWDSVEAAGATLSKVPYDVFLSTGEVEAPEDADDRVLRVSAGLFTRAPEEAGRELLQLLVTWRGTKASAAGS